MYLDDITVTDIDTETQVTPVTAGMAITIPFNTLSGLEYTVWSADVVGGPYTARATYTGTGGTIIWADTTTAGVGKRFYKVSVELP